MDHFGLRSVKELPKLKDLHIADNEIGMPNDLADEEAVPVDVAPGHLIEHDGISQNGNGAVHDSNEEGADDGLEQDLPDADTENE